MGLPRVFVGFSSTDIHDFRLMQAWKAHEQIDFDFCDCQLPDAIDSENERYIKSRLMDRIDMAGTYILLIGKDTHTKHTYVKWEVEVALAKECRIFALNLDHWRILNPMTCPIFIQNVGSLFMPFSSRIVAHALKDFRRQISNDWFYETIDYTSRGYILSNGDRVARIPHEQFGF